jgi:hypothetical protein
MCGYAFHNGRELVSEKPSSQKGRPLHNYKLALRSPPWRLLYTLTSMVAELPWKLVTEGEWKRNCTRAGVAAGGSARDSDEARTSPVGSLHTLRPCREAAFAKLLKREPVISPGGGQSAHCSRNALG